PEFRGESAVWTALRNLLGRVLPRAEKLVVELCREDFVGLGSGTGGHSSPGGNFYIQSKKRAYVCSTRNIAAIALGVCGYARRIVRGGRGGAGGRGGFLPAIADTADAAIRVSRKCAFGRLSAGGATPAWMEKDRRAAAGRGGAPSRKAFYARGPRVGAGIGA